MSFMSQMLFCNPKNRQIDLGSHLGIFVLEHLGQIMLLVCISKSVLSSSSLHIHVYGLLKKPNMTHETYDSMIVAFGLIWFKTSSGLISPVCSRLCV